MVPFRRYVPSGKFAGPMLKPFRGFLDVTVKSGFGSPSSCFLFVPIVHEVVVDRMSSRYFCQRSVDFEWCGGKMT